MKIPTGLWQAYRTAPRWAQGITLVLIGAAVALVIVGTASCRGSVPVIVRTQVITLDCVMEQNGEGEIVMKCLENGQDQGDDDVNIDQQGDDDVDIDPPEPLGWGPDGPPPSWLN